MGSDPSLGGFTSSTELGLDSAAPIGCILASSPCTSRSAFANSSTGEERSQASLHRGDSFGSPDHVSDDRGDLVVAAVVRMTAIRSAHPVSAFKLPKSVSHL